MFKKGSKLYSMFGLKCPRCQSADIYTSSSAYKLNDLGKMPERCPNCHQNFSPEPGFYFGATYVSYAITIAFFGLGFLSNYLLFDLEFNLILGLLLGLFLLISPVVFRLSRSVWLGFFVRYDSTAGPENLSQPSGRAQW